MGPEGDGMADIDADAHVIETERTWDYMRDEDQVFRPADLSAD